MAPSTRGNHILTDKIATLQLRLSPFVPLPLGAPHPAFPSTLMAFHLLTEDELDSMASYYHQSTPCLWTRHYPAPMNWDKDFLARPAHSPSHRGAESLLQSGAEAWRKTLPKREHRTELPPDGARGRDGEGHQAKMPPVSLRDDDRLRIKRRKFGKFIGLVGMETPTEEIIARVHWNAEQALESSRRELLRDKRAMLPGPK